MQKNQGEIGQAALLSIIHGFCRTAGVLAFGGTHFDEDHAIAVKRHQVQLSLGTAEVLSEDAIAQATSEEPSCRPLRARAKPAPPPRFASFGFGRHEDLGRENRIVGRQLRALTQPGSPRR